LIARWIVDQITPSNVKPKGLELRYSRDPLWRNEATVCAKFLSIYGQFFPTDFAKTGKRTHRKSSRIALIEHDYPPLI